jgi:CIC family chloride channel protein
MGGSPPDLEPGRLRRWTLGPALTPAFTRPALRRRVIHRYDGADVHLLALSLVVGVVAGIGALVFRWALDTCTRLLLVDLGGYSPATTVGEGGAMPASSFARPWAIPLVVGLGGLVAGLLVFTFAPEAEGHGTDAAISAVHHEPTRIRPRVVLVKLIASAITIGSGGSGGREGPTAQISAGAASTMSRALHLPHDKARLLVTAGMAAGIASIFRAPLGGAMLGVELLYRDDLESDALMPSLFASVTGYLVYGSVDGFTPIFGNESAITFTGPSQFAWFAVLGALAGLTARAYAGTFYATVDACRSIRLPRWLLPALAGVLVGIIGLALPGVLGTGYGTVQNLFTTDGVLALPLGVLVLVPVAKIVATSLSVGSGGSGGIFGPGMVIGATLGAATWRVLHDVAPAVGLGGSVGPSPAVYVLVGMVAVFGAIAHAPVAMLLMVAEMTQNLAVVPPAMLALAIASLIVGETSIYRSQLGTRTAQPALP